MSIYNIDYSVITNLLNVPSKRLKTFIAFFAALMKPLQWRNDLFADDYIVGASYSSWSNAVGYPLGARTIYTDKANYECINPGGAFGNSQSPLNPLYWLKIQDNFIGSDERVKYNSQIIVLEYALNRWFRNPQPNPQIYIATTGTGSQFLMGQTSTYSSKISNTGFYASTFMGNSYTPAQYDFIVYFPIALFNGLPPASNPDKEKVIRNFVDKYKLAGTLYQVVTF